MNRTGWVASARALLAARTLRAMAAVAVVAPLLLVPSATATAAVDPRETVAAGPGVCPAAAATVTAAQAAAKACGGPVEVVAGRSEYSQAFANSDGSTTVESSAVPARVRRPDGSWAKVDTTLAARPDGTLAPAATVADVVFSAGGTGPFVTYRVAGQTLTLSWPSSLPAPSVSGETARYPDVLPGVDLLVSATPTGFRHVLEVMTASAAANPALRQISYQVGGTVMAASLPDGRLRFADRTGRTVAIADDASMWDSATGAAPASDAAGPGEGAGQAKLGVGTTTGREVILTPDPAMLTGSGRVFPEFIDPSIGPVDTKWAYADNANANNSLATKALVGLDPGDGRLYRSFMDFPTTSGSLTFKGKHVLSAKFNIELYHSWSCGPTPAYLYRPNGTITVSTGGRMAWSTLPLGTSATYLATASGNANKAGGCGGVAQPDMLMTFTASTFTTDVQYAADHNFATYPVGLCACTSSGSGESTTDRWKKFYVDSRTTLSVTYNTKPGKPANLSAAGVACGGVVATTSPVLQAQYVDGDTGDTLSGSFKWQQLPSGTVTTVAGPSKPANNNGSITLNLGSGAEGKTYQFQVTTNDGHDTSPPSDWCSFTVNSLAPTAPTITPTASGGAPVYAACDPTAIDTCPPNGGPGVAGAFTFSEPAGAAGASVTTYVYGFTNPPTISVAATSTGGPSPTLLLTPPHYGLNTLYVSSRNSAGTASPISTWKFLVNAPSAALGRWPLDNIRGHGFNDQIGTANLVVDAQANDVAWIPDVRYVGANAASFDHTAGGVGGWASTSLPALDTSASFSVAAWVRLADMAGDHAVVSKDGTQDSAFRLEYRTDADAWCFSLRAKDVAGAQTGKVCGPKPLVGRWTSLVAVYNDADQSITLYVDGVPYQAALSASFRTDWAGGWNASGPFTVGRGRDAGAAVGQTTGEIADVLAWNRVVTVDDIAGTDADPATGVPAVAGLLDPVQVGAWDFNGGVDCFCGSVLDGAYFGRPLTLDPGWVNTPPTSSFVYDGHDGNDAVTFDGLSGDATTDVGGTAQPVLRTDQSFTVSAWVRLAPSPCTGSNGTILGQDGVHVSAFALEYHCATSRYSFWVGDADVGNPGHTRAFGTPTEPLGAWTMVTGVYDAPNHQIRIYLDGVPQSTVAEPDTMFYATGSLTVGRQRYGDSSVAYLAAAVDQVGLWQGVLSDRQILDLANAG